MNRLKAFIALMAIVFAADAACAAEDIRTLDENCKYVERLDGQPLTYREALDVAIQTFSASSDNARLIDRVNKNIPEAMELFGKGPISKEEFEYEFSKGLYEDLKNINNAFVDALYKIKLPFQATEAAKNFVYSLHLEDINYALRGILWGNAYHSKEG